ncbi:MAG TPA: DNA polymerase III subunit gamma/tau [Flavobacteriales bacterium]|nr:DNA polymerase III subunit gamma/tau [Flavobacteriales bacterium]
MEAAQQPQYTVSARKYRPQHWDAVVGQDSITRTLKQAIDQEQIAQAYLFCGPRGVGKTTSARIFARAINGFDANDQEDYAFNVFELDAASNNKVEDIRSIVDQVRIPPQQGQYKVYIIDEVHMLSQAAFNAFLKTLEEPPPHAVFILATTEKHKILPTILSRCQIFDFHRITVPDMVEHLKGICAKEGIEAEEAALHVVAVKADGALRDALSIFDQLVAFAGKKLDYATVAEHLHVLDQQTYFDVVDAVREAEVAKALLILDGIISRGFDPHHFITGLGAHLRNLLMSKDASTVALMEVTDDVKAQFSTQSASVDLRFLVRALDAVNQADVQYKGSNHQRLLVELTLMQLASFTEAEKKKPELTPIEAGAWSVDAPPPKAQANPVPAAAAPPAPAPTPAPEPKPAPTAEQSKAEEPLQSAPAPAPVREKPKAPTVQAVPSLGIAAPSTLMDVAKPVEAAEPAAVREQPVTAEAVEKAWEAFIVTVESEGQFNLHTTLKATTMGFDNSTITLTVLNRLQTEQIREVQLRLNQYFADQLENDTLKLVVEIAELESAAASTEFMNDRERYDEMVKKNPKLDELRKRLDLDLLG